MYSLAIRGFAFAVVLLCSQTVRAEAPPSDRPADDPAIATGQPEAKATPSPRLSADAYLAAELEYGRRLIGFARPKGDDVRALVAFQGTYEPRSLANDALYETLGRPDLANKFRNRRIARYVIPSVGGLIAAAGLATILITTETHSSATRTGEQAMIGGLVAMLVGGTTAFVSIFIGPDPINKDEAKQLVDDYNRNLRHQLGLPPPEYLRPPAPPVSVAPVVGPHGGGLVMALTF